MESKQFCKACTIIFWLKGIACHFLDGNSLFKSVSFHVKILAKYILTPSFKLNHGFQDSIFNQFLEFFFCEMLCKTFNGNGFHLGELNTE